MSGATGATGRVALVTGATGGMGRVITTELARLGFTVVVVCRTAARGDDVVRHVAERVPDAVVEVLTGDLAERADLHRVAAGFAERHPALNVLVNNAGAHFRDRVLNSDGVEMHVAVNHLAGFTLTALLLDQLRAGAPARVVNVVSASMSDTRQVPIRDAPRPVRLDNLDDLRLVNPAEGFEPFEAYARSKLLTTMCGYVLADRLRDSGVTVNAVHPGLVATDIIADIAPRVAKPFLGLVRRGLLTPEEGARAALRLATDPALDGVTGRYFVRDEERRSPEVSYDPELRERVWTASREHAI
ncbi:SDR family NAD(P)-dependent oxidoreductase [Umezawaea tangerina]|uniref:NAD(P)-dependent dehydrogenase (Short-subunit alcohol dehydrogenase family) n=1 Tax=Umezawaea tangerina TaxID=84725 RepID=A0A2T0TG09_9PSEU|nr:SDR family NAD(P)-dependent oxidoreductase [Umezawaea tangerina]PRY44571.1 NAD(P)-dependent dehydrogenase (short-subunit alcohol dehydrogenase family) [Umezawaea tangerina]